MKIRLLILLSLFVYLMALAQKPKCSIYVRVDSVDVNGHRIAHQPIYLEVSGDKAFPDRRFLIAKYGEWYQVSAGEGFHTWKITSKGYVSQDGMADLHASNRVYAPWNSTRDDIVVKATPNTVLDIRLEKDDGSKVHIYGNSFQRPY